MITQVNMVCKYLFIMVPGILDTTNIELLLVAHKFCQIQYAFQGMV